MSNTKVKESYEVIDCCRSCGGKELVEILSLGETPLADRLLTVQQLNEPILKVPLTLNYCINCTLLQIAETVEPELLFCRDYPYFSSVSSHLMNHFRQSALDIIKSRKLDQNSLVIEAASNDGYLLQHFKKKGIEVLGIDPATAQSEQAQKKGINSLNTFFSLDLAKQLLQEGKKADVFLANNVLAHVSDVNGFVKGIKLLLKDDGIAVIEFPYVVDLVENGEFDTIYHQHLSYFSVKSVDTLLRQHQLYLNHLIHTDIHGGSLRLFIEPKENVQSSVIELLLEEKERGICSLTYYKSFSKNVLCIKEEVNALLQCLKRQGKSIAGYGAAAKGNTLLSYLGIGKETFDYIVDLNPYKQGKFMDGNCLPILSPVELLEQPPDYLFILAWNFAPEIIQQQKEYHQLGGRFIIPIPELKIL